MRKKIYIMTIASVMFKGVELEVKFDYDPPEHGCPGMYYFKSISVGGIDITQLLEDDEELTMIEELLEEQRNV